MKILKYVLLVLAGLLGIYLLLCVAGPKNLDTSVTKEIKAPPLFVFNLVNNLKNGELWNDWSLRDTSMRTTYNQVAEGTGARSSWTSDTQGSGTQEIIESTQPNLVRSQLKFEGYEGYNYASFQIEPVESGSSVTWNFESGSPVPFLQRGVFLLMGVKKFMKNAYEAGLKNIQALAEERAVEMKYFGYVIDEQMVDERNFIMRRDRVRIDNMQQYYATHLGALFGLAQKAKVEMAGMPCGLFFAVDDQNKTADMAAAIPVAIPVNVQGAASFQIPAQEALVTQHFGEYSGLTQAHRAVEAFMKDRGYLFNPPFVEEYVTDPGIEKDPNKIQTTLTYYFSD